MTATDHLRCTTSGCGGTIQGLSPGIARAIIEYHSRDYPAHAITAVCERCSKTSVYSYDEVLAQIPEQERPQPMPADHFWAQVLIEFTTSRSAEQRTHLGDRILVQRLYIDPDKSWYGVVKSTSLYAPSLRVLSYVKGRSRGRYEVCEFIVGEGNPKPIVRPQKIVRTSSYAIFVEDVQSAGEGGELLCANVMCSNPSCGFIYSMMTYEKFKKIAAPAPASQTFYGTGAVPIVVLTCEQCRTVQIIDDRSFVGLFKGALSDFKK